MFFLLISISVFAGRQTDEKDIVVSYTKSAATNSHSNAPNSTGNSVVGWGVKKGPASSNGKSMQSNGTSTLIIYDKKQQAPVSPR